MTDHIDNAPSLGGKGNNPITEPGLGGDAYWNSQITPEMWKSLNARYLSLIENTNTGHDSHRPYFFTQDPDSLTSITKHARQRGMIGKNDRVFLYGFIRDGDRILSRLEYGDDSDGKGFDRFDQRKNFGITMSGKDWRPANQEELNQIPDNRTYDEPPQNPKRITDADAYYLGRIGIEIFEKWPSRERILTEVHEIQNILNQRGQHRILLDIRGVEVAVTEVDIPEEKIQPIEHLLKTNKILRSNDQLLSLSARIRSNPNRRTNFDLVMRTKEPDVFPEVEYVEHDIGVTEYYGGNININTTRVYVSDKEGLRASYDWAQEKGKQAEENESARTLDLILRSKTPVFTELVSKTLEAIR